MMDRFEFMDNYFIAYQLNQDMTDDEPEQFVLHIHGTLYSRKAPSVPLGVIEGEVLPVGEWRFRTIDLFDGAGEQTLDLYEDYYAPYVLKGEELVLLGLDGKPMKSVVETPYGDNICHIGMVGLKREWRGKGLGLVMMREFIERFARHGLCDTILLKPSPQVFDEAQLDFDCGDRVGGGNVDNQALKEYYARLGFREIQGTDLMFLDAEWKEFGIDVQPPFDC